MTIVLALACKNGIAMASDSEVSSGPFRQVARKIYKFGDSILWSASGNLGLIQQVKQRIDSLPPENTLSPLPALANVLEEIAAAVVCQARDRHRRALGDPKAVPRLDLLFAGWNGRQPALLHIDENSGSEWLESFGWAATGLGEMFAYPLLRPHRIREMSVERGLVLAYKVIEDAIECGAYGLGYPVELCRIITVTEGAQPRVEGTFLEGAEREAIKGAVDVWRQLEAETLSRVSEEPNPSQ